MTKTQITKVKISITLDIKDFGDFQKFCRSNGMTVSSRIKYLSKNDLQLRTYKYIQTKDV
jgi:hypothetical protein